MKRVAVLLSLAPSGAVATTATGRERVVAPESCIRRSDHAKVIRFRAPDRIRLAGAVLGSGRVGVVLGHQTNQDYCGVLPFARILAARGYRALVFSFRNYGSSGRETIPNKHHDRDFAGAVAELRRRGARKVFLIGASLGGTAALVAATRISPPAAGVVDLSGPAEWTDLHALDAVRKLTLPSLFVVSRFDVSFLADTRAMYRAAASKDKRLVVRPGGEHGTDLVDGPRGAPVRALVFAFLRAH